MRKLKIALAVALALGCVGCEASNEFVEASRLRFKAVAPDWRAYFEADATLDDRQKQRRRDVLQAWALDLREHGADVEEVR